MGQRNIKLTIAYDGTRYHGWQIQPGRPTVQGKLVEAVGRLTGKAVDIFGSSRTDAGVHALGQVANMHIDTPVPTERMPRAITRLLPNDISVTEAEDMPAAFDAIRDTKSKIYRYTLNTSPKKSPLDIRFCWHRPGRLDTAAMNAAAGLLIGTHDFKSFASAADKRTSSVRTILECSVMRQEYFTYFDIRADGFLYNMVRNIVGTLVEVGRGRWTPERVGTILKACDRTAAGPLAPASGLCLMKIFYE